MKYLILTLLFVSTSVFAQGYGYYPNQQYQYNSYEQQRELQQEFLDEQYWNQRELMEMRRLNRDIDRKREERRRDRSVFPGW